MLRIVGGGGRKKEGVFTVKTAYKVLGTTWLEGVNWGGVKNCVFGYLWKSLAPSKVVAF